MEFFLINIMVRYGTTISYGFINTLIKEIYLLEKLNYRKFKTTLFYELSHFRPKKHKKYTSQ